MPPSPSPCGAGCRPHTKAGHALHPAPPATSARVAHTPSLLQTHSRQRKPCPAMMGWAQPPCPNCTSHHKHSTAHWAAGWYTWGSFPQLSSFSLMEQRDVLAVKGKSQSQQPLSSMDKDTNFLIKTTASPSNPPLGHILGAEMPKPASSAAAQVVLCRL